jgi:hypothetical protein
MQVDILHSSSFLCSFFSNNASLSNIFLDEYSKWFGSNTFFFLETTMIHSVFCNYQALAHCCIRPTYYILLSIDPGCSQSFPLPPEEYRYWGTWHKTISCTAQIWWAISLQDFLQEMMEANCVMSHQPTIRTKNHENTLVGSKVASCLWFYTT